VYAKLEAWKVVQLNNSVEDVVIIEDIVFREDAIVEERKALIGNAIVAGRKTLTNIILIRIYIYRVGCS